MARAAVDKIPLQHSIPPYRTDPKPDPEPEPEPQAVPKPEALSANEGA